MRKIKYVSLLALSGFAVLGAALTSCSSNKVSVYSLNTENKVKKVGTCELLFKKNSRIPYVSLKDGTELMSLVRSTNLDDKKYKVEFVKDGNNYVISNEAGAKCVIDKDKQTLTYNDYDKLVSVVPDYQQPLSIIPVKKTSKALKVVSNHYTPGNERVISLKDYSLLDIYEVGDKAYLPLSVYNSVLLNTNDNMNLAYNGKYLFFMAGSSLSDNSLGFPVETPLGEKFRKGAAKEKLSDEELEYYYQSLCFDFNNSYGLREKFDSFDEFLKMIDFKKDILSTNPKKIDAATALALTYLRDGHTALTDFSNLYEFGTNTFDTTKIDTESKKHSDADEAFTNAKKAAKVKTGLDYKDDTVFVDFAQFTNIDEDLLYNTTSGDDDLDLDDFTGGDDIPGLDFGLADLLETNTAKLFNQLYKDLTSDTYKNTIKNVVIDLTTNAGGAADALIYSLSTLIGNVTIDIVDPITSAHNKQVYQADINADGKIDENDKPLSELGFNIYFLNSAYSFSSANAMPVLAKLNNPKVITLGAKTAGGPCAVRNYITTIGSVYASSSLYTISKEENGKYVNIDGGVNADFVLTEDKMIDRDFIKNNIKNYKK
jgi:hypothetical protein